jgi:hypothetical protein
MIIVTLVATLAASMVWQQWRAVQVEGAERARAQSAWILAGALDWARLILKEDARSGAGANARRPSRRAVGRAARGSAPLHLLGRRSVEHRRCARCIPLRVDQPTRSPGSTWPTCSRRMETPDPDQVEVLFRLCEATGISTERRDADHIRAP